MREPKPKHGLYALVAEFEQPEPLLAAARAVRQAGFVQVEAFTPYPVEGLDEAVGFRERRIAPLILAGGLAGAALGLGLQVYTNLDFPLNIGGRPLLAWPAFALIAFELAVLGAVASGVIGMLLLNRLPRLSHPLFEIDRFRFATDDRFFLAVLANDPAFDERAVRQLLRAQSARRIAAAPFTEAPE